jgi:Ca-activated chloride channel homolog
MTNPLPILSDDEVSRWRPDAEEPGFGALETARGHLPLKALDVHARIDGLLAQVQVRQTFVNTHDQPLEATYIFPLPDRAAATGFRMEVGGRVVEGKLKERAAARRQYDEALRAGHRAAITEEERPGVFTLRVGNLMPREEATVRLTLSGPLPFADGEATFRFPLVVPPRYIPGAALPGPGVGAGTAADTDAVPDASRITPPVLLPGHPNPVRLTLAVDLHPAGLPLGEVRSSLHAVMTAQDAEGGRRVTVQPGERLDRDFILRFRLAERAVRTALVVHPDADGSGQGTFLLTVVPPREDAGTARRPRDVAFVLDRSGSMSGWKIVAARRAMARMVETLTDRDRFTVLVFSEGVETPPEFAEAGLLPADDRNRFRAAEFLGRVEARGGTEMARPLGLAVRELAGGDAGRERILVLVTDGQVGNEDQILRSLGPWAGNLRIFTLGIDQAVNEGFLKRLAALGGGACEFVESEERLEQVMQSVHRRIDTPLLTGLRLDGAAPGGSLEDVVPGRLPDLFPGAPLLIQGRYRGAAPEGLVVHGGDAAGRPWRATVPATVSPNPAVAVAWARACLRELEDQYVIGEGDRRPLERRIVELSLRHGVLCRFTAFVAVDQSGVVNPGGEVHRVVQPVEQPRGWSFFQAAGMTAGPGDSLSELAEDLGHGAVYKAQMPGRSAALGLPLSRQRRAPNPEPSPSAGLTCCPTPVPIDLTVFRQRARELLDQQRAFPGTEPKARLAELRRLADGLATLIGDLKRAGAPPGEWLRLEALLRDVRRHVGHWFPRAADVAGLWDRFALALQAFAGPPAPTLPPSGTRDQFWK